jgi:UDP-2-acetamido-2,6-beta-L-arabino-hexul-4-ose reductase
MNILVTGADGFIGRNLCLTLGRMPDIVVLKYDIDGSKNYLNDFLLKTDIIYHLAGINRPKNIEDYNDNFEFTKYICDFLRQNKKSIPIAFSSSTQVLSGNIYGESKKRAENYIKEYGEALNVPVYIYRFPNIFGKWSRPNYNSVVSTFCYNVANDIDIEISDRNKIIEFVYIDDVINCLLEIVTFTSRNAKILLNNYPAYKISLGELADKIRSFKDVRTSLQIDDQADTFTRLLYSTYLSYYNPNNLAYTSEKKTDDRGWLFELIKSKHVGQIFISKTKPGVIRGNHYHDTKIEKFCVISGLGIIRLRNLLNNKIVEYKVSEDPIKIIDIPPGYTHSIKNIGDTDMITIFWSNEILNTENPDTYHLEV